MVEADQPSIFQGHSVECKLSSSSDGSTQPKISPAKEVYGNILKFTKNRQSVLMRTTYDRDNFTQIRDVTSTTPVVNESCEPMVIADAFVCSTPGITLCLPVADCVAIAMFDPVNQVAALIHAGRHASIEDIVTKVVNHLIKNYNTIASSLLVYLSPSIKKSHYKMDFWSHQNEPDWQDFTENKDGGFFIDLPGYNVDRLLSAGVNRDNIEVSAINTAVNDSYGSAYVNARNPQKSADRFLLTIKLLS